MILTARCLISLVLLTDENVKKNEMEFQKMGLGFFSLLFLIGFLNIVNAASETFSEELFIKPLPTGHLYSYFQFTTKWDVNPEEIKCI